MIRFWLLLIVFLSVQTFGQLDTAGFQEQAGILVREYSKEGRFSGELLLARDGDLLFHVSMLRSKVQEPDKMQEAEIHPESAKPGAAQLYCLASVSKIFTGTLVLLLEKEGELSMEQSIRDFFPDLPQIYEPVKIRHLLTHTSGLPGTSVNWQDRIGECNQDVLDFLMKAEELEFEPGTSYQYSNYAFILLAMLVEGVSGKDYGEQLQDEIFSSAGMLHSFVPLSQDEHGRNRELEEHGVVHSYLGNERADWPLYSYGSGGIYSNARDMFKWDSHFFSGKLFDEEELDRIFTPVLVKGKEQHYGLGWGVYNLPGETLLGHSGGMFGFRSLYEHQKNSGLCIIILGNMGDAMPLMEIRTRIINLLSACETR